MQRDRAKLKFFVNKVEDGENAVIPDLAITPAQMLKMAESGIPISSHQLGNVYDDGMVNPSWEVPLDRQRGIDVNHMWSHNKDVKARIKDIYSKTMKGE